MRSEPWAGILFVGVFRKAGIREEITGCPLPNTSEHLVATTLARRNFPFEFGRQPAARPSAILLGLEPGNVGHRTVKFQRNPLVEVAAKPVTSLAPPVDRMRRTCVFN